MTKKGDEEMLDEPHPLRDKSLCSIIWCIDELSHGVKEPEHSNGVSPTQYVIPRGNALKFLVATQKPVEETVRAGRGRRA